jgi:hypothetical protein
VVGHPLIIGSEEIARVKRKLAEFAEQTGENLLVTWRAEQCLNPHGVVLRDGSVLGSFRAAMVSLYPPDAGPVGAYVDLFFEVNRDIGKVLSEAFLWGLLPGTIGGQIVSLAGLNLVRAVRRRIQISNRKRGQLTQS